MALFLNLVKHLRFLHKPEHSHFNFAKCTSQIAQLLVYDLLPFTVHLKPSRLPGAGLGVFVSHAVPAGTALCLYPGNIFK